MIKYSSSLKHLSEVCTSEIDGVSNKRKFTSPCLKVDDITEGLLEPFAVMCETHPTDTFKSIWNEKTGEVIWNGRCPLSLQDVQTLFQDSVCRCKKIVEDLNSQTITLSEVNMYFLHLDSHEEMRKEIDNLTTAVNEFSEKAELELPKDEVLTRIELYRDLSSYKDATDTLTKLRAVLGLVEIEPEDSKRFEVCNLK